MAPSGEINIDVDVAQGAAVAVARGNNIHNKRMIRSQQPAEGPATVLGIGTAVPPTEFPQSSYPDLFFDICNCNEKTELKAKFKRICKAPATHITISTPETSTKMIAKEICLPHVYESAQCQ
jgi:chalcone synthase